MTTMPSLDEAALAKLAREMAMNIRNVHTIFAEYGIDETGYYELMAHNDFFKRAKEQFTLEWNATTSTVDRVKMLSAAAAEQVLPVITTRALNPNEPFMAVLKSYENMTRAAGIGSDKTSEANSAERFVIQINLGETTETYNRSIEINPKDVTLDSKSMHPKAESLKALMGRFE